MKSLLVTLFCLVGLSNIAQSYTDLINNANKFYTENEFVKSAEEYEKAFQLEKGSAEDYYNAACSWALIEDTVSALKYLNLSADNGWKNLKHLKNDQDLKNLRFTVGWTELTKKVQANLDEFERDFDKPLKEQLEKMYVRDQTLRQLYATAEEKFGRESEEMTFFWEIVSEQDSLNLVEVLAILDEKGWVGMSLVGGQANMTLWLVIQHASIDVQEKYLPLLRESVKQRESSGNHLAMLEDRINMAHNKPQVYGSQIITDEKTGVQSVYEVFEPEYVNERREEVGLGPIEDYLKRWGIQWTIEQKKK